MDKEKEDIELEIDIDHEMSDEEIDAETERVYDRMFPAMRIRKKLSNFYQRIKRPIVTVTITGLSIASGWMAACIYYNYGVPAQPYEPSIPAMEDNDIAVEDEDGKLMLRLRKEMEVLRAPDGRVIIRDRQTNDLYVEPEQLEQILEKYQNKTPGLNTPNMVPPSQRQKPPLMVDYGLQKGYDTIEGKVTEI